MIEVWLLFGAPFRADHTLCEARGTCFRVSGLVAFLPLGSYLLWRPLPVSPSAGG